MSQQQQLYQALFESADDAILVMQEGCINEANPSAQALLGLPRDELLGRTLLDFSAPAQPDGRESARALAERLTAVNQGEKQSFAWLHQRPDGHTFRGYLTLNRLLINNTPLIQVSIRDDNRERPPDDDLPGAPAELRLQTESLKTIAAIADSLYYSLDFETVIERALDALAAYTQAPLLIIFKLDSSGANLEMLASRGFSPEALAVGSTLSLEGSLTGIAVARREIVTSDDLAADERVTPLVKEALIKQGITGTAISAPLLFHEQALGAINIIYPETRVLSGHERETLLSIGKTIGLAMSNAQYVSRIEAEIQERQALEQTLQHAAERRGRQVQTATLVAQEIGAAPDLDLLYRGVVTLVKEQFGYYHVQLLRYDPGLNAMLLIAGYGPIGDQMAAMGHKLPLGVGIIGAAAANGQSVLRADVSADREWQPNPLLPETRGEIAVPIMLGRQLLGVLDVQSNVAGSLDTEDQLLLEGLCGQIAAAIESTRLRQEMAERLEELHRLQRFFSQEGWQAYRARRESDHRGYIYDQAALRPIPLAQLPANTPDNPAPESGAQQQPLMTTPLTVRGATIGALGVHYDPQQPLAPEDESLLESISVQVAEALESARLLEQTQKRAGELETVARVSTAASTILQVDTLLQTVVDLAQDRFDLYYVSIFLYNQESETLALVAGSGDIGRAIAAEQVSIPLRQEQSLVAKAARERQASIINDVRNDPAYQAHALLPNTRAEMVIPMVLGDRLVGVLDVEAEIANAFTTDDLRIQTTLAAQVAVAVQNARLYAEQLATTEKLREVDRLKSEFLASMSHELRTPLNSIIGFADVLLEGLDGQLNERMEEDVGLIRESGRHLRELIGEILDMSKIEAGMMDLRFEKVNPRQLAREVIASTSTLSQGKPLEFILDLDPDLAETVHADRTRFMQVLLNMVSNAVKFTEAGSVTLTMRMDGDNLYTAVTDTGIGINPEHLPIVFEQFRQVDGSVTRVVGGTGLGMPISKKLVELHGGDMGVHSTPGEGSTFWFTIPEMQQNWKKPDTGPLRKPGTGPLRRSVN